MELRQVADALGIETYPPEMELPLSEESARICDPDWIRKVSEEYPVFGEFVEDICAGAEALKQDELRLQWGRAAVTAFDTTGKLTGIPMPEPDGTVAGDILPVLVHVCALPGAIANYRKRGVPEDILWGSMYTYAGSIRTSRDRTGRVTLVPTYYGWLRNYAEARIFRFKNFNFEITKLKENACWLKNKEDGRLVPVMCRGTFHRSGLVLGSAGCEDEEGAFTVEYAETDTCYRGHRSDENVRVSPVAEEFPKALWEKVLAPGDAVVSVHIPRGSDISPETTHADLSEGMTLVQKCYPDYAIKAFYCSSWLLDPDLKNILGENSRIVKFGNIFCRYPIQSNGRHIYGFVFNANLKGPEEMPENTRLERGLKQLYLSGGYNYAYAGVFL